jgi:hypothetical protein
VHNKLLTGDNLEKRNIAGPHRCELCRSNPETAQHLFLECNLPRKHGGSLFWTCRFQPSLRALLLNCSPLGTISILIASPPNPSGKKFGQQSPNSFAGSYGWLVMTKFLMEIDTPLFRLQLKLKHSSWKQPNNSTSKKILCSVLKKGDGLPA